MWQPDAADVLALARVGGLTLGSAESLTGGAVSVAMTTPPGASDVWRGAVVSYHSEVKQSVLGVPQSVLDSVGPVSADTALAMAHGARSLLGVDVAVATTGVAGPDPHGGHAVGTVIIAVVGPGLARCAEHALIGDRRAIVDQAVDAALRALFESLGGHDPQPPGNGEQL